VSGDMSTDPQQIRDQVDAVLTGLPAIAPGAVDQIDMADIDTVGRRLEEAHQVLVDALESVEKG
jgi:hypothetical protein